MLKKVLLTVSGILLVVIVVIYFSPYRYIFKAVRIIYLTGHTSAFLTDYQYFHNEKVPAAAYPQPWPFHEKYNTKKISDSLEALNKKAKTVAYLVIKNDSLFFEKYYEDYGPDSKSNSFSMAKSILSALLGKAISEGHIKSLDQPVKDFLLQLKGPYAEVVTMGDLSSMSSGLN